jgi:type VI secretion system protein ImpH
MAPGSALARLMKEPRRFRFDAGVRLLMHAAGTPDPAQAVRFRSVPGLGFPGADITAVRAAEGGGPPRLTTPVMGLTGTTGVLPRYYTEVLGQTLRDRSRAMHDFIDLLSHGMVGHFASAGVKYRLARAVETARLAPQDQARRDPNRPDALPPDPVAMMLLSLTGYGTGHLRGRLAAGTDPLLHYAGLLTMRPRSADRLAALASDWLGRRVEVVQFAGAWLTLDPDQRTSMPVGRRAGQFNRLGVDAAIGTRAWDVQARVVLRVGPLDRASFAALLPDRPALRQLVSLVRAFLGFETGFAINPVLAADAVPEVQLGADGGARLGWNTWMPTPGRRRSRDVADAVFEAEVVEAGDPR